MKGVPAVINSCTVNPEGNLFMGWAHILLGHLLRTSPVSSGIPQATPEAAETELRRYLRKAGFDEAEIPAATVETDEA